MKLWKGDVKPLTRSRQMQSFQCPRFIVLIGLGLPSIPECWASIWILRIIARLFLDVSPEWVQTKRNDSIEIIRKHQWLLALLRIVMVTPLISDNRWTVSRSNAIMDVVRCSLGSLYWCHPTVHLDTDSSTDGLTHRVRQSVTLSSHEILPTNSKSFLFSVQF